MTMGDFLPGSCTVVSRESPDQERQKYLFLISLSALPHQLPYRNRTKQTTKKQYQVTLCRIASCDFSSQGFRGTLKTLLTVIPASASSHLDSRTLGAFLSILRDSRGEVHLAKRARRCKELAVEKRNTRVSNLKKFPL